MGAGKKIALGVVVFFVVVLLGLAITVPILLDVDRYRPQVVAHVRRETGKPAEIGRLGLRLFPKLGIRVDEFALGNPAGFPEGNFLKVRRINVDLDAGALWDRRILIKSIELSEPVINLLSDVRGRWNFENSTQAKVLKAASVPDKPLFSLGVIAKVSVAGARLAVTNLLPSGRRGLTFFEARGVSSQLQLVDLNGFAGSNSASLVPPASLDRELTAAGGWASIALAAEPRSMPVALGRLKAESLNFGALQVTGVKAELRLLPKRVYFDDLSFDLYSGRATGALEVDLAGANPRYNALAQMSGVDVARLFAAFPEARGKMTGRMDGNFKLSAEVTHSTDPLAGMRGTGQVNVRDGQLPSLQLNKNLMLLARLSNLGPVFGDTSSFSSISADLNIANDRISSNRIIVMGNGLEVNGSGSVALVGPGSLDYQGVAKLLAGQNAVSNFLQNLTGATSEGGKLSFPFMVSGTLENPKFLLKSMERAGQSSGLQSLGTGQQTTAQPGQATPQPSELIQGISGLFKKRKQTQPQQPTVQPK